MAQPIAKYNGNYITCYPGSNQKDDGKLNLEHNMARIVTRLSSKNFCTTNPSFVLKEVVNNDTGLPQIQVGIGECSINGMDIVVTTTLNIDPPEAKGTYYLAFKLARDSSQNVLGDLVYGTNTTFEGVYLTYYDSRVENDPDVLNLGSLNWNGTNFENIVEDEDKYGRLWAEDILSKLIDPKHPDINRINLQEWIYNVSDWYISKEGDNLFGPLTLMDNRTNSNPGILMNVDENGSYMVVKDPNENNNKLQLFGDVNRDGIIDSTDVSLIQQYIEGKTTFTDLQKILADVNGDGVVDVSDIEFINNYINKEGNPGNTGNIYFIDLGTYGLNIITNNEKIELDLGTASLKYNIEDSSFTVNNPLDLNINTDKDLSLIGKENVVIGTDLTNNPNLTLTNDTLSFSSPNNNNSFTLKFPNASTIQQTLGGAIWQYSGTTKVVSLLPNNVTNLTIEPDAIFKQDLTVYDSLYVGQNQASYLQNLNWRLSETGSNARYIDFLPQSITIVNPQLSATNNSFILLKNTNNSIHSKLFDDGKLELLNNVRNPAILFKDGTSAYDVTLEKLNKQNTLNLNGNLNLFNLTASEVLAGNVVITNSGVINFIKGQNNSSITKDNNLDILRTSGDFYVGASANKTLYSGNINNKGTFTTGSSGQCVVDNNGNLNTSGTITGAKVYNAVYNDIAEFMEKADYNEIIEPGDIVYFNEEGKVTKYRIGINQNAIAGIVSSEETYGYALGGEGLEDYQKVPIALKGRVNVKTYDIEFRAGDILAVNNLGYVFKQRDDVIRINTLGIATRSSKDGKVWLMLK